MEENILSYNEFYKQKIFDKMLKFCVYRDRCHKEASIKLLALKVDEVTSDEIISELINEGVLNEERYVRSFVRGKFRMSKWGRNKIKTGLRKNNIPDQLIKIGLEEIDEDDYLKTLKHLLEEKSRYIKAKNQYEKFNKLKVYAFGKGYETELTNIVLEEMK